MRVTVFAVLWPLFVERFLERLGMLQMRGEDRPCAFQQALQFRVLGVRNQRIGHYTDDRRVIADFVIDVGLVELSAAHSFELRHHFVAICFQAFAGGAFFRRHTELLGQCRSFGIHRRVIADHRFGEFFDFFVAAFLRSHFTGVDVDAVGDDRDHCDLGVIEALPQRCWFERAQY